MNANNIIDVTPVEYSSNRHASGNSGASERAQVHASSQSTQYQWPTWKTASYHRGEASDRDREYFGYGSAYTRFGGQEATAKTPGSVLGGFVQIAVGAGLVLVGIPMLILPGPGLLSILGGMALAGNGMRKLIS